MDDKVVNQNDESRTDSWSSQHAQVTPAPTRKGPPTVVWLMLGVLSLLALAVIFVLPGVVENYELPFTPRAEITEPVRPNTNQTATTAALSPFEEAQRAKYSSGVPLPSDVL